MSRIPRPALLLGFAGILPFLAGMMAAYGLMPGIGNPFTGILILQTYGSAILAFMGGCFWGFAAQAGRMGWKEGVVSVIPALWAFGVAFAPDALIALMMGFVLLFLLDLLFRGWGLGPKWWIALRLPLTVGVLICLGLGKLA